MSISRSSTQPSNSDRQQVLVENPRVFVDFHNADDQGCLRLNCIGTLEDLSAQKIELQPGQHLTLYSEDLEVDGIVEYSQSEHLWIVVIDWDEIREIEENIDSCHTSGVSNRQLLQKVKLVKSMSTSARSLEEIVRDLSPQLRVEVQAFVESLLVKSSQPIMRKLRQDWANMLKADNYTSVELQHLAVKWRNG